MTGATNGLKAMLMDLPEDSPFTESDGVSYMKFDKMIFNPDTGDVSLWWKNQVLYTFNPEPLETLVITGLDAKIKMTISDSLV